MNIKHILSTTPCTHLRPSFSQNSNLAHFVIHTYIVHELCGLPKGFKRKQHLLVVYHWCTLLIYFSEEGWCTLIDMYFLAHIISKAEQETAVTDIWQPESLRMSHIRVVSGFYDLRLLFLQFLSYSAALHSCSIRRMVYEGCLCWHSVNHS